MIDSRNPGRGHGFWRRVASLTRKEVRQLFRNRANMLIGLALPIALILIFGYGLIAGRKECKGGWSSWKTHTPQAHEAWPPASRCPLT